MTRATLIVLGSALLVFTGCAVEKNASPQAETSTLAPEPESPTEELAAEADGTIRGSFTAVISLLSAPPSITTGDDATWNPNTNTLTFYDTVKEIDAYGFRYNYQCVGQIHYDLKSGTPTQDGFVCDTVMKDGKPVSTTVTWPESGFLSAEVSFQY